VAAHQLSQGLGIALGAETLKKIAVAHRIHRASSFILFLPSQRSSCRNFSNLPEYACLFRLSDFAVG